MYVTTTSSTTTTTSRRGLLLQPMKVIFICLMSVALLAPYLTSALAQGEPNKQQQQCLDAFSLFMEEVGPQGMQPRVVDLVASTVEGDDEAILLEWNTEFTDEYSRVLQACPPTTTTTNNNQPSSSSSSSSSSSFSSSLYFTGFCQPAASSSPEEEDQSAIATATTVRYQLGALSETNRVAIGNLTTGVEYNCTVTAFHFYQEGQDALQGRASILATPSSSSSEEEKEEEEECDRIIAELDPESLFLGVVDSSSDNEIEFSWHFPEDVDYMQCLERFEVQCDLLSEDLHAGMRQAASAIQHRAGSLDPAKQNLGLALLGGLEHGMIYSCSLRVRDDQGQYKVASRNELFVEPGYPKLLKDTSEGGENKCSDGQNFGLVNSTTLFVRNGCQGVFLLPGDYGLMCQSSGSSYVECYLPAAAAEATAAAGGGGGGGLGSAGDIEVFWQQSMEPCYSKETFGFASPTEMFVLDGCEGQFMVYPSASTSASASEEEEEEEEGALIKSAEAEQNFFVVSCEGDQRREPAYTQEVKTRRWWCLFICKTTSQDPQGYYTCPIVPLAQDLIGNP